MTGLEMFLLAVVVVLAIRSFGHQRRLDAISNVVKLHNETLERQVRTTEALKGGQRTQDQAISALGQSFSRVTQMFVEERKLP